MSVGDGFHELSEYHFLRGHYQWDGQRWQLFVDMWDSLTAPANGQVRYSNCAFCHPEQRARA